MDRYKNILVILSFHMWRVIDRLPGPDQVCIQPLSIPIEVDYLGLQVVQDFGVILE